MAKDSSVQKLVTELDKSPEEPKKTRTIRPLSAELTAMRRIEAIIEALSDDEMQRVTNWINSKTHARLLAKIPVRQLGRQYGHEPNSEPSPLSPFQQGP